MEFYQTMAELALLYKRKVSPSHRTIIFLKRTKSCTRQDHIKCDDIRKASHVYSVHKYRIKWLRHREKNKSC